MKTGGQLIVEALEANGVTRIFSVAGESYLAVLDALHDSPIQNIVCRQEGGAAIMADCEGRLTGRPGICFVSRGPGATNASIGVHIARQDSVPMILFVGQIARGTIDREAFQEMDYRAFFGSVAKWVVEINDPARIPELVTRAFAVASSGRPGPVVVSLPEDMLVEKADAPQILPFVPVETRPGAEEMQELKERLSQAERPLVILGGTRWNERAVEEMAGALEAWKLPAGCSFRRQGLLDPLHPCYAGDVGAGLNPILGKYVEDSDLIVLVGGRFSELASSDYRLMKVPYPAQKLVHIHADPQEIGRVYRPTLGINATPAAFAAAFAKLVPAGSDKWSGATEQLHGSYLAWSTPPQANPGAVQMGPIIRYLQEALPGDTIVANGAGNFTTWANRFHRYRSFSTQAAPTAGAMGYGVPAAVAAKLAFPERLVVVFSGDGDFMMNGQEFATAVQYKTPIVVIVLDNNSYGTIRMHQEREYPGRISGTELVNPDFAGFARICNGHGETVAETDQFIPAFERAVASGRPSIIHVKLDIEAITPSRTLSDIRGAK